MGRIAPLMQALQLSLVFMMSDVWLPARYYPAVREANRDVPVVAYCPIDSGPVDAEVLAALAGINRFVVYNEFARREVENAVARIRQDDPQFAFPEVDVLPHGVDRATFHPFCGSACGDVDCDGRRQAITSLFGDDPEMRGAFIVLNANRNQPRKRIDITIRGFAKFAADKPANVKLHLHMGLTDAVWDIPKLARRFGVYDRLIVTAPSASLPAMPDEQMNAIYNAAIVMGGPTECYHAIFDATPARRLYSRPRRPTSTPAAPGRGRCARRGR
jgi:glycosyltransferase involved in cell wall biosynthesis